MVGVLTLFLVGMHLTRFKKSSSGMSQTHHTKEPVDKRSPLLCQIDLLLLADLESAELFISLLCKATISQVCLSLSGTFFHYREVGHT